MNLAFFWSDGFKTGFSSLPCTLLYIILICFPVRGESNDEYALLYVFHKEDMKIKQKRKKEIGVNKTGYLWLFIQPGTGYEQVMNGHGCFCHFVQFLLCTGNKRKHK